MDKKEIEEHLGLGEDSKWEFISKISHPDELAPEIVAMANSEGGTILLGVSDKGEPLATLDKDAMNKTIALVDNISRENIEPSLLLTWEKIEINSHIILAIRVPKGPDRPYRTNKGVYYIRAGASKRQISRQELARLFQSSGSFFPDESPVLNTGISDIDVDYLCKAWPELCTIDEPSSARLKDCGIISNYEEALTFGGLICFGKEPQKRLPYAKITAIRFPEGDLEGGHRYLERIEIEGRIENQAREATQFVKRHLGIMEEILRPASEPNPLLLAIQEGLVNALVHREYNLPSQIRLFVFDDRIEVLSPGRLLNTVNLSELALGCHAVRNRIIFAHALRLKLVHNVGLGIPTMFRLMKKAGLPLPEISLVGGEFRLVLRRYGMV
ncbi:MAG: RNA-binding domain-containing protein [bacterium]